MPGATYFVVQMRARGAAAAADSRDDVAALDMIADPDAARAQVPVVGLYAIAVIDDYREAITAAYARKDDDTVRGRDNLGANGATEIAQL